MYTKHRHWYLFDANNNLNPNLLNDFIFNFLFIFIPLIKTLHCVKELYLIITRNVKCL